MARNLGKPFEDRFRKDWLNQFPGTLVYRVPDQQSGYSGGGSQNPCDFICFNGNDLFMIECKSHKGASIPFTDIPQYDRLIKYKGLLKVFPGILVWLYEKDLVFWISIEEMEKMVNDGYKSVGIKAIKEQKYNIIVIPSKKLRFYMESNYLEVLPKITQRSN